MVYDGTIVVYIGERAGRDVLELVEELRRAGVKVVVQKAGDVRDAVLVGPFGIIRGLGEARIIVNQLLKS